MMKKLTALLLCVAMLMVGVVAQAESGYVFLKNFLSDSEQLGNGYSQTNDSAVGFDTWLVLIFDFPDEQIGLMGCNAKGKYEGTVWGTDNMSEFITYLKTMCEVWSTIEGTMDEGYSLHIMLILDDDESPLVIDSEEQATTVLEILQSN